MNRVWIVCLISFFFLGEVFADLSPIEERLSILEEKRGLIEHKRKYQWFAAGEFLYWKADIDGVAYAITTVFESGNGLIGLINDKYKTRTPHFSYDPGFRVALGFRSPYDLFDFDLVWLRFYTHGKDHAKGTLIRALPAQGDKQIFDAIGLISGPLVSIPNEGSVHCGVKENLLDFQLGRGVRFSKHFFIRPFFGLRGAWNDLSWKIHIERDFFIPLFFAQDETELKVRNSFHGIGGLIGLDIDWRCMHGIGLVARTKGALVYGKTEEKTRQNYVYLPAEATTPLTQQFRAHNGSHAVKGMIELFTGIFWETILSEKHQVNLRLILGYEFQWWPYLGQKTNVQALRERERFSLGFQGFNIGGGIVF